MAVSCFIVGGCHAHNVGVSLLDAMEMREGWVAHSEAEYVRLALQAAGDIDALAALRGRLRGHMLASRLCDGPAFVRQLEDVYRQLWLRRAAVSRGRCGAAAAATAAAADSGGAAVGRQHSAPLDDARSAAWEAAQSGRAATS